MILRLYSVYDRKTAVFYPPFTGLSDGAVQRELRMNLRAGVTMYEFPQDFDLFQVGVFADESGAVDAVNPTRLVCRLDSLVPRGGDAGATVCEAERKEGRPVPSGPNGV